MSPTSSDASLPPTPHCAHCGEPVVDRSHAFLLLDLDHLPHTVELDVVKRCCMPQFREEHGHAWTLFPLASPHARRIAESIERRAAAAPTTDQPNR